MLRVHPNSSSSGSSITPVVDRKAAAEINVAKVIVAIHQARCIRGEAGRLKLRHQSLALSMTLILDYSNQNKLLGA
jgi:hypothetical protein